MRVVGLISLLTLLSPLSALADSGYVSQIELMRPSPGLRWNGFTGEYRFAWHQLSEFRLDRSGTASPMSSWAEHRLRWSPSLQWRRFGLKLSMDVVDGHLFGDTEALAPQVERYEGRGSYAGRGVDGFLLREAYLQVLTKVGMLRLGQVTSSYGLGILSNSGQDDDDRFGLRRYGDVVDRVMLGITPLRPVLKPGALLGSLTLILAGDMVFRDENADLLAGDRAWMGNVGLFLMDPRYTNGVVFTYRTQDDEDGDDLEAWVLNVNGKNRFSLWGAPGADQGLLHVGYEAAWLWGHTTRFQQLGSEDGLDLESFGAAGRVGLELTGPGLDFELEGGYASGDENPYDDTSHAFYFDPDYNLGLIFFDEMLPLITARSVEISADPSHMAVAPKGLDLIPTQGRVTNTFYGFPQARWTWQAGKPWLEELKILAGGLLLFTPAKLAHSYYTFESGGAPTNHLGRVTDSSYLGTEVLLGLRAKVWPWKEHLGLILRADQAVFLPGAALRNVAGDTMDPVWKTVVSAGLIWR